MVTYWDIAELLVSCNDLRNNGNSAVHRKIRKVVLSKEQLNFKRKQTSISMIAKPETNYLPVESINLKPAVIG